MEVRLSLPVGGEGAWRLLSAEGQALASGEGDPPTLIVEPYFYEGVARQQALLRAVVVGAGGKQTRSIVRVDGCNGKLRIEAEETIRRRIQAPYDRLGATERTVSRGRPAGGKRTGAEEADGS
jgi:hypothetical protein